MKNVSPTQLKILSLASFIFMLISLSTYSLWIYVFSLRTTHIERVEVFRDFFSGYLDSRWGTTLLSIILCALAILLSGICFKLLKKLWRSLNIVILIISSLLLLLNLFSMM